MPTVEQRLHSAGFELPTPATPVANYTPTARVGNLMFVSGQGPTIAGQPAYQGVVGLSISEEDAFLAAQLCALNSIAALKAGLGDLSRVKRIVKVLGFVASAPDFERQPFVMNGASDLFVTAFGEAGKHVRSALGTNKLPFDIPVEIEILAELNED
jgi:enamine deaminase RidA (YjgF/YER057c/UK114 family)